MHRSLIAIISFTCATAIAGGDVPAMAENPYAQHYSGQAAPDRGRALEPHIHRGQDREADGQRLLEDGYDMLGASTFQAGEVSAELLAEQARSLRADLALVYSTPLVSEPASVKLDRARARMRGDTAAAGNAAESARVLYDYYATYWSKLPPPLLGVHVRGTAQAAEGQTGLRVLAVIRNSPAALAGIRKGDTLLRLGEVSLSGPDLLGPTARRYAGQSVAVVVERDGEILSRLTTLGRR